MTQAKAWGALRSHYLGAAVWGPSKAQAKYTHVLRKGVSWVTLLRRDGYRCVTFHSMEKVTVPRVT
jgi:hypothetical protein